jgi:hypothetical protein
LDSAIITACVTLVGFIIVNFIGEDFRRFRNGSSVAAGLAGELASYVEPQKTLMTIIDVMIKLLDEGKRADLPFRGIDPPKDRIFDANLANLGLLGPELVEQVAYVYGQIGGFRVSFGMVHNQHAEMTDGEIKARLLGSSLALDSAGKAGVELIAKLTFMVLAGHPG